MFDGNHRVRKDVNLSGRRQRQRTISGAGGKAQVLEESRRQREERRLQQLQQESARTLQRVVRGCWMRKRMVKDLLSIDASERSTLQLSMLLSLMSLQQSNNCQALLQYEQRLLLTKETISILSKQRIVQSALKELVACDANPSLLRILQYFMEQHDDGRNAPITITMDTFLVLIQTCQQWMGVAAADDNNNHNQITLTLWRWSCQTAATLQAKNKLSLAYLGATLFGYTSDSSSIQKYQSVAATYFDIAADDSSCWTYQSLLHALTEEFGKSDDDTTMTDASISDSNIHTMVKDCESKIVCRAMELYESLTSTSSNINNNNVAPNPHTLLQLIDSLLSKPASHATVMLTCLKIRGENVRSMVLEGRQEEEVKQMQDDDDDDEGEDDDGPATALQQKQNRRATGARHTRQQIQTVPRLNQLYQDDLSRLRKETLTYFQTNADMSVRTNAVELAEYLSQATLWQQWGMAVLNQQMTPSSSASKRAYLRLLGRLLQGCSGFRTMTTSPFLSQLAFSKPFLEALWRHTLVVLVNGNEQEEITWLSTTIFCDVFAHHLISLSDKDFLASYTTASLNHGAISSPSSTTPPTILVEHVVGNLKTLLYDFYWMKPVVASDVQVDGSDSTALRARLFLSGTKLWNALYERWTRLVRQAPFCDESTWWFPRLASRDDDGAVIGSRENVAGDDDDDEDPMDVDGSDDEEDVNENALENDALADTFRDPKMARLLTSIPQALPFDRRVKLFNSLLNADKVKTQDESADFRRAVARMMQRGEENEAMDMGGRERVEIRRDAMYFDSMDQLNQLGSRLKRKVQVTMVNKHGAQEAGIDGGGVFKEFLDDLIKEAFNPEADNTPRLFSVTPLQTLAVNMDAAYDKDILSHYEFLGRVLGKAVYESILVEPQFCLPFLNQLLGKLNSLEDLKNFDLEFYNNLTKMRSLSESDIESMGLTFELNVGTSRTVPLIPGGSKLPVTKQNVIHYIHLVAHQRINIEGATQTKAFLRGFRDLIPASWVRLFSSYELQKMISGDDSVRGIDVQNLKEAMVYAGGYHQSQSMMKWFWEVIEELTPDHQRQFLRFMTSCSRQPLLGFRALEPLPCVQQIRVPEHLLASDETKKSVPLPSSSTCMNLLKLPNYNDKELLRKKLIAAIEAGAGFELT